MSKPLIILIGGKAESGKTTSGTIIKNQLLEKGIKNILFLNYGDAVKWIAKDYYGWNGQKDVKGRDLLQKVGNLGRKEVKNFWIKLVENTFCNVFSEKPQVVIIGDVRFKNELTYFYSKDEYKTFSIYVTRKNFENSLTEKQKLDESEKSLRAVWFDKRIEAENLMELTRKIKEVVEEDIIKLI